MKKLPASFLRYSLSLFLLFYAQPLLSTFLIRITLCAMDITR